MTTDSLTVEGVEYTRHPLSALFGDLSNDDAVLLKTSISQVGQQRPILLAAGEGNIVLDGWNRLGVMCELGLQPITRRAEAGQDEVQLVTAVNLAQRTLSAGQRALIAARLASYTHGGWRADAGRPFAGDGATRDPEGLDNNQRLNLAFDSFAPQAGGSATSSDDQFAIVDATAKSGATDDKPLSLSDAANQLGVSRAYAVRARAVAEKAAPEVIEAIQRGEISLNEAAEISSKPIETQAQYVARRIKEGTEFTRRAAREAAPRARTVAKYIKKHGRPPEDATTEEVQNCVAGLLLDGWTNLNIICNLINMGALTIKPDAANQFLAGVDSFKSTIGR